MFAGHFGAALALKPVDRRVNLGLLFFGAMFLDIVLWILVLSGAEQLVVPADFEVLHYMRFVFPWSHSLLASIAWSLLLAAIFRFAWRGRGRAGFVALAAGMAVFSHYVLDVLVHPALPFAPASGGGFGFGLWDHLGAALSIESLIALGGLVVFLRSARLSKPRAAGLVLLVLAIVAMTVGGMLYAPPPPSPAAAAVSSLITIASVCALAAWIDRRPVQAPPAGP